MYIDNFFSKIVKIIKNNKVNIVTFNDVDFNKFNDKINHQVTFFNNGWHDALELIKMLYENELPFMIIDKDIFIFHFDEKGVYNNDSIMLSSYELDKIDSYKAKIKLDNDTNEFLEKV